MPSFLIETYLAPGAAGERAVREQSASSAEEELTREGTRVRFEGSTHVPEDEMCCLVRKGVTRMRNVHSIGRHGPSTRTRTSIAIALGVGFLLLVGVAVATPPGGVLSAPVHARGTLGEDQLVNSKSGVHVKTKGSADLVSQQIVIAGGGHTGWHSHPGPVLVTVKRGALRLIYANDETCTGTVYEAGDSFIDRGDAVVHIARNESLLNEVELWATYFVPGDPGAAFRLDEPAGSSC